MADVSAVPAGYHSVTPYLICGNAAQAIDYYKRVFGAEEIMRMTMPNGKIGHAELKIGDSHIMLAEAGLEPNTKAPESYGGSPVAILVYIEDVDTVFNRAVAEGGRAVRQPQDMFYGDRTSWVVDPFGHSWYIHTHVKDVTPEEMKQAMGG
jgi:PhnB protein